MLVHLATFAAALFVLVRSADYLVEYAARIAKRFHVSDLIVGLVITSIGTSLPELASSLSAAIAGNPGLVVGNVVGSNIANVGLVLGCAAAVRPFATESRMHDRDGFILVASAALFLLLALDNRFGRIDAAIFLSVYVAYVVFAARSDREGREHRFRDFLRFFFDLELAAPVARRIARGRGARPATTESSEARETSAMLREIGIVIVSLAALIASARIVVQEAVWLAELLGMPENLIGLSLVAIGTSLPELLVAISGARKGKAELVVGNVMGSNIANTLLIVGASASVRPLEVAELSVVYTIPIMLFFSLALLHFVRTDWRITRRQGALAVTAYLAFLAAAFLQGWG